MRMLETGAAATILGAILLGVAPRAAWGQDDLPPAVTHYYGRQIAPTMHFSHAAWLLRPEREQEEHCTALLELLDVPPGATAADIGCGNGFYTLKLAQAVGEEGRVLAVDIQPEMLHLLEARAKDAGVRNVQPVQGTVADPKLPEGSVDLAILVDVYHEFSHPEPMLAGLRRALKPHGRIVLVEFRAEDPDVPIRPLHKMSKEQILKELPPNGFRLVHEDDSLPWQHVMWFGRDDEPTEDEPGGA